LGIPIFHFLLDLVGKETHLPKRSAPTRTTHTRRRPTTTTAQTNCKKVRKGVCRYFIQRIDFFPPNPTLSYVWEEDPRTGPQHTILLSTLAQTEQGREEGRPNENPELHFAYHPNVPIYKPYRPQSSFPKCARYHPPTPVLRTTKLSSGVTT